MKVFGWFVMSICYFILTLHRNENRVTARVTPRRCYIDPVAWLWVQIYIKIWYLGMSYMVILMTTDCSNKNKILLINSTIIFLCILIINLMTLYQSYENIIIISSNNVHKLHNDIFMMCIEKRGVNTLFFMLVFCYTS